MCEKMSEKMTYMFFPVIKTSYLFCAWKKASSNGRSLFQY